ncbi:MAG TPA: hypothetical protein VFK21_06295 [Gammaproteobacteria bacterium]|nr:hypothetical protein [Gammaproteobacteria bacterium]
MKSICVGSLSIMLGVYATAFAMPPKGGTAAIDAYSAMAITGCGRSEALLGSPDGKLKLTHSKDATGARHWQAETAAGARPLETRAWPCPEFLWAPDSSALAVTYREGGDAGDSHMGVYRFGSDTKDPIDVTAAAEADFLAHRPRCAAMPEPNLAAVAWLEGANRLLVAAQVPRHSDCDDRGTFALYEVSVPDGKVLAKYGQLEAKQRFGDKLGSALRRADDRCITQPGSCHAPYAPEKGDGVHKT